MKRSIVFSAVAILAGPLLAADSSLKDNLTGAAKKLADQSNYSWKSTVEMAGGSGRFGGPTEGKTEKDGYTFLSMTRGDNTIEAVLKGTKGALKGQDGWQSLEELAADQGRGQFMGRMLRNFKAPAAQAEDLAGKVKELKQDGDTYGGDLTEAGAKSLLTFGGRGGGNGPEVSGAKGSAKFWIKDGVLSKYEFNVQGTVSFNGNDRDVNRTTTVEIKDVGTTKVTVPDEASKKIS